MYAFIHFLIQTGIKRNCQKLHIIIKFQIYNRLKWKKMKIVVEILVAFFYFFIFSTKSKK